MHRWSKGAAVAAVVAVLAMPEAHANGRFPATTNVRFRDGDDQYILLAATFGLLQSSDNGATFYWVCEDAIGYGGTYDPDYAVAADGAVYATTFEGLRVTRDGGCTWSSIGGPLANKWVGEVEIASDGKVWAATSSGGMPNDVYVSQNGSDFVSANLAHATAWWKTMRIAPTNPDRVYVTGYLVSGATTNDAGMPLPEALLRRTDDGGDTWVELDVGDFAFPPQPQLFLVGVSPVDADVVFARVLGANGPVGDAIYRSADAGDTWTKVLDMTDTIRAFHIRPDGMTMFAGTVKAGVQKSTDGGLTWNAAPAEPEMACLGERGDGTMFACGANWDPDFFAVGRSADGAAWDPVLRFSQIVGPLACEPGTVQFDTCAALLWPSLADQFGISAADAGPVNPDAGPGKKDPKGCFGCSTSRPDAGWLALIAALGAIAWSRRRRVVWGQRVVSPRGRRSDSA